MSNDLQQINDIVQQTAFNIRAISEQMGIVESKVKNHETRLTSLEEKTDREYNEFINFKKYVKENEYIEPEKVEKLKTAMGNRVVDLLSPLHLSQSAFGEFYGKFMSKFWWDCKKHSYAVGKAGVYTKERHFNDLMEYVGEWIPEGYGSAKGYIDHLEAKKQRNA